MIHKHHNLQMEVELSGAFGKWKNWLALWMSRNNNSKTTHTTCEINEWQNMTCYSNPAAAIHYVSIKILSPYHSLHSKLPITDAPQMLKVIWLLGRQETDQTQDYHFHVGNAKVSVFPLAIWKWDQRYIHPRSSSWKSLTSFRILSRRLLNMNLLISLSSK